MSYVFIVIIVVCAFQLFYLINSFNISILNVPVSIPPGIASTPDSRISIIMPICSSDLFVTISLHSIFANSLDFVEKIVLVLDRCTEDQKRDILNVTSNYKLSLTEIEIIELPSHATGKVEALLFASSRVETEAALLIDADIVLDSLAIATLLEFHTKTESFFSTCLIFPFLQEGKAHSLVQQINCLNRLYRQSILQLVKNNYGVANFPGGLQLVHLDSYIELLNNGFLEDLTATYKVLASGRSISVLPVVLAFEVERKTILGLFFQRVRWTIGAIQHVPSQVRAAFSRDGIICKLLILSYHVMWELQYYIIILCLLSLFFHPHYAALLLVPFFLYSFTILRMQLLTFLYYATSPLSIALHVFLYPLVITIALAGSLVYLLRKRSFLFEASTLYQRI